MTNKPEKTRKCPWCGKTAPLTKKGALRPHRTPGNQNCCGAGIRIDFPPPSDPGDA